MGNICRSPTAEGVFRALASRHSELHEIKIDSCGTIGYHVGEPPDPRSVEAANRRGYDLSSIRSRKLSSDDFVRFDYILVMDEDNLANTKYFANENNLPTKHIKLFLDFAKDSPLTEVPDPYYGGASGFDDVIDLIEAASDGLIGELMDR